MLQYRVWATRFWIWFVSLWSHQFEAFKIQLSPQIISCDHREWVWSVNLINYGSDYLILFLDQKFFFSFLPNRSTISWVLYLFVFSSLLSFQRYIPCGFFIAWDHHHHFQFWSSGENRVTVATGKKIQIWPLSILIFNWSPPFVDFLISLLLLNCFSKISFVQIVPKFAQKFLEI
jgi:hypothetical protein